MYCSIELSQFRSDPTVATSTPGPTRCHLWTIRSDENSLSKVTQYGPGGIALLELRAPPARLTLRLLFASYVTYSGGGLAAWAPSALSAKAVAPMRRASRVETGDIAIPPEGPGVGLSRPTPFPSFTLPTGPPPSERRARGPASSAPHGCVHPLRRRTHWRSTQESERPAAHPSRSEPGPCAARSRSACSGFP